MKARQSITLGMSLYSNKNLSDYIAALNIVENFTQICYTLTVRYL